MVITRIRGLLLGTFLGMISLSAQDESPYSWTLTASAYNALNTADNGESEFHDLMTTARRTGPGLNLIAGTVKADWGRIQSQVTLQYGEVPLATTGISFPIQEAWIGVRATDDVRILAGLFLSPAGAETNVPFDNYSGIISAPGFFEPGYSPGIKFFAQLSDNLLVHADVMASYFGRTIDGKLPAFAATLEHTLDSSTQVVWSNVVSEEPTGILNQYQLYSQASFVHHTGQLHFIGELNVAVELPNKSSVAHAMTSGFVGGYWDFAQHAQIGLRAECMYDPFGVLADDRYASPLPIVRLDIAGITATATYALAPWCKVRVDLRRLTAIDELSVVDANPPVRALSEAVLTVDMQLSSKTLSY